jgi:hypothetical protein
MYKQPDQKYVNFLGHNNPPVNIKSIDFINLKIYDIELITWKKIKV